MAYPANAGATAAAPIPRVDPILPMLFRLMPDRSTGSTNDALVDHLKSSGSIRSPAIEAAFRVVDRAEFLPVDTSEGYDDAPVRHGYFHMSQPSLYADALENLDLRPGLSFLNVGSGTGYLSSIVSEITGPAMHHGIDLHQEVLDHAEKMFRKQHKDYIQVFRVNVHDVDLVLSPRYDRIYLGACAGGVSKQTLALLQVGGVCVGPFETATGQYIRRIVRKSEDRFEAKNLKQVSFGRLQPSETSSGPKFLLPSTAWTPETHKSHSPGFKKAVHTVLLCTTKPESPIHVLPRDLLVKHVFGFMHPRCFQEATADFKECLDGNDEMAMEDEGSFDEVAARIRMLQTLASFARHRRAQEGLDEEEGEEDPRSLHQLFQILRRRDDEEMADPQ